MLFAKLFPAAQRQIDRSIWKIVLPCLLESLLTYAVGLVTSAMIGRLMADDISAQGIGMRITGLIQAFFRGIGVGATVLVGVHYGAKRLQQCRRTVEQTMLVVFGLSLVCVGLVLAFPQPLMRLFTNDPALLAAAAPYLKIAVWLCPGAAMVRIVTAAFNGQGDTRTPLVIAVLTNVANAAIGYVLIFGMGPVPAMGLRGAAWGLVISNCIGISLGLFALYRKNGLYGIVPREGKLWHIDRAELKAVFTTGLPASGENMMWTFAAMVMGRVLLSYGSGVYAAYQLASQCEEFFAAPAFGFQVAATTLSAQCIGNGDRNALRQYYRRICILSTVISLPCMLVMLGFPQFFMMLLTDKEPIQSIGALYLVIAALAYIPQMLNMVSFGTVRAMGYKNVPIVGTVIGMWGLRVPVAALAAWVFHADIGVVFAGIALDQYVRLAFVWIYMKAKKLLSKNTAPKSERSAISE